MLRGMGKVEEQCFVAMMQKLKIVEVYDEGVIVLCDYQKPGCPNKNISIERF